MWHLHQSRWHFGLGWLDDRLIHWWKARRQYMRWWDQEVIGVRGPWVRTERPYYVQDLARKSTWQGPTMIMSDHIWTESGSHESDAISSGRSAPLCCLVWWGGDSHAVTVMLSNPDPDALILFWPSFCVLLPRMWSLWCCLTHHGSKCVTRLSGQNYDKS
jgi:hypothetical protein